MKESALREVNVVPVSLIKFQLRASQVPLQYLFMNGKGSDIRSYTPINLCMGKEYESRC